MIWPDEIGVALRFVGAAGVGIGVGVGVAVGVGIGVGVGVGVGFGKVVALATLEYAELPPAL